MPDLPQPEYLDIHDAARYLRVHPQTLARLIRRHRVPVHLRQGTNVIKRADIDASRRRNQIDLSSATKQG